MLDTYIPTLNCIGTDLPVVDIYVLAQEIVIVFRVRVRYTYNKYLNICSKLFAFNKDRYHSHSYRRLNIN